MQKLAFIGLGNMGFPMAGHLARQGHALTVYNRTTAKRDAWLSQHPGQAANTPREAAQAADVILSCVGNDQDLREVMLGEHGVLQGVKPGAIVLDHSTVSADISRELASRFAADNITFMDAPVSGGQQGAQNGQLTIMCGGDPQVFAQIKPLLTAYAKAVTLMGPVGSGQLTKMVNQICVGGLLQALAEGLHFAEKAGLNSHQVMEVVTQGAASSWQMVNRHQGMLAGHYEHGFAVDWMRKDFAICLDEARRCGASLPVTALVDQFYAEVQAMGGGRWDTSSLLARLKSQPNKPR